MNIVRQLGWATSGDLVGRAMTLASTLLIARVLSPGAFGQFLALSAVAILATVAFDAGVTQLMARDVALGSRTPIAALRAAMAVRKQSLGPWLVVYALVLFLSSVHSSWATRAAFLAFSAAASLSTLTNGILRGGGRFRPSALATVVGRLATFVAVVAFVSQGAHLTVAVAGCLFAMAEFCTATIGGCLIGLPRRVTFESVRLRSALPFLANSSLATLYNRCDVILVAALAGSAQLSLYGPASRLQDGLYVLPGAVGAVAVPVIGRSANDHARQRLAIRLALCGALITLPVALALELTASTVASRVFGIAYLGSAGPIRILIWFLPLAMLQAPLFALLIVSDRAIDTTKVVATTLVAALGAHSLLDAHWGANGAAVASLARDLVATPLCVWFALGIRRRARGSISNFNLEVAQ